MMTKIFKYLWDCIDVVLFICAIAFFVWGFFEISFTAGLFGAGFGALALGLLIDLATAQSQQKGE